VTAQFAAQAAVNANVTNALAAARAAQAEQAAAQAAAMSNVTETLAAVLGGLSALQAGVGALAARMDAVEANTGLLESLVVVSPPPPPPLPPVPPSPPPSSPYIVTTFAGCGPSQWADGLGTAACFNTPTGVAVSNSSVFVADLNNHVIRVATPSGLVSTLAGSGSFGSSDGPVLTATFSQVYNVAVNSIGDVYNVSITRCYETAPERRRYLPLTVRTSPTTQRTSSTENADRAA
jgi:hypothetical protein